MAHGAYQGKTITILGLGKTGLSCLEYFQHQSVTLQLMDTRPADKITHVLPTGIACHFGSINQQWLDRSDMIVISPGLSVRHPAIQQAIAQGVEVIGDIELFCREADKPIIAITGSNGKSTVTTLVAEMIKAAGLKVGMGGNIGIPALSLLDNHYDVYVLELSSFQLETTLSLKAKAATVLNISEDHMDRYDDLEDYRQAKLNIYHNAETIVVNADDPLTLDTRYTGKSVSFGIHHADYHLASDDEQTALAYQNEAILAVNQLGLVGRHNQLNALAALALVDTLAIPRTVSCEVLKRFKGLDHRFQLVCRENGITWVNDSKATNVGSTLAALSGLSIQGKLHLLLGGDGKGADFSVLKSAVDKAHIYLYCFGRDGKQLARLSSQSYLFETMQQAIESLSSNLQQGDWVLLSPACASLDQFKNFEQRGEIFAQLAQQYARNR